MISFVVLSFAVGWWLFIYFRRNVKNLIATQKNIKAVNQLLHEEISKHELTTSRLKYKNTLFEVLFNSINNALYCIDIDGKVLHTNHRGALLVAMEPSQTLHLNLFKHLNYLPFTKEQLAESLAKKDHLFYEDIGALDIFGWQHTALKVTVLHNDYYRGYLLSFNDRTVETKTMQKLMFDQKMSSMGDVAAGIAHEINNPLMGISSAAALLERKFQLKNPRDVETIEKLGFTTDQARQLINALRVAPVVTNIKSASEIAGSIVTNMLNFARQDLNHFEVINIGSLVDMTLQPLISDVSSKITINYQSPPMDMNIECNSIEIRQVLDNVIDNAQHAVSEVELPEISVSLTQQEDIISIRIKNNGPKIDNERFNHIFSPFFTTKQVGEGTGIGLSVCYYIVKHRHNGNIFVEASDSDFTTFTIELPTRQPQGSSQSLPVSNRLSEGTH